MAVKAAVRFSDAERVASERDKQLRPLPKKPSPEAKALAKELEKSHPALIRSSTEEPAKYAIVEAAAKDPNFFTYGYDGDRLVQIGRAHV